eukprot:263230-Pyramimonas_sp.AAC.1
MPGANCWPLRILRVLRTLLPGRIINARSRLQATSCSSCSQNAILVSYLDCPEPTVKLRLRQAEADAG